MEKLGLFDESFFMVVADPDFELWAEVFRALLTHVKSLRVSHPNTLKDLLGTKLTMRLTTNSLYTKRNAIIWYFASSCNSSLYVLLRREKSTLLKLRPCLLFVVR